VNNNEQYCSIKDVKVISLLSQTELYSVELIKIQNKLEV
jgi:hypothetical protein